MNSAQRREWARQQSLLLKDIEDAHADYLAAWDAAIQENEYRTQEVSVTDEQLVSLASALGFPILGTPILMRMPHWRQGMLNLRRNVQSALDGDKEAEEFVNFLINRFSTVGF